MINSIFDEITFRQIETLFDILRTTSERDYEFVKKTYEPNGGNFIEALEFFTSLGVVNIENDKIVPTTTSEQLFSESTLQTSGTKTLLIKRLLLASHPYTEEISAFLNNFRLINGNFTYKPTTGRRLKESKLRNFFIELGLIHYDRTNQIYEIADQHVTIFAKYCSKQRVTQETLSSLLESQEILGRLAELEVLEYEKKRLAGHPDLLKLLEHTAILDVGAGYDIKSYEIESNQADGIIPRYIEVKAVSQINFQFYWTKNEIDKSRLCGNRYYLYLLPVAKVNEFNIESLKIIQNPFEKVFRNNHDWEKQEQQYIVWKKKIN